MNYLQSISYAQYLAIKKAAELEEIGDRLTLITDMNAAFNGGKEYMETLVKKYNFLIGNSKKLLDVAPDPDWKNKLNKFKR